jgi:biotin carboxyl carrier protein
MDVTLKARIARTGLGVWLTWAAAPVTAAQPTIEAPLPGRLHAWAVTPGEAVAVDQVVCTIERAGVVHEIESAIAGRVARLLVDVGADVARGEALMVLEA